VKDSQIYVAKCPQRQLNRCAFFDVQLVDTDRGSKLDPSWMVPSAPNDDCFIKKSGIWAYITPDLEAKVKHEVEVCEQLILYPHPNVAIYRGCQVANSRVVGIRYRKYRETLINIVNPEGLNKGAFVRRGQRAIDKAVKQSIIDGIEGAIRHLHSLNLIYNDITPMNIMLDTNLTWILIDFVSCRKIGESLEGVKRTYGWYDPAITTTTEQNDWDTLAELKVWLLGILVHDFIFIEG